MATRCFLSCALKEPAFTGAGTDMTEEGMSMYYFFEQVAVVDHCGYGSGHAVVYDSSSKHQPQGPRTERFV